MHPRGTLDIGWRDLFFALRRTYGNPDPANLEREIESFWSAGCDPPGAGTLVSLSVRSGFDALLQALDLPAGSEIIVSALTIHDMIRIIEAHNLVAVPVDLNMETLSVSREQIELAITPQTRAILIAHIFGARMPLGEVIATARTRNLLVFEDCAQAYAYRGDRGHPEADFSMFSFGPIKTNTALAGGILQFRDAKLLELTRWVQGNYPRQSTGLFRGRVVKYIGIKALTRPFAFSLFVRTCQMTGKSYDAVISGSLRSFPGHEFLARIRRQPSGPLLALLRRRITTYDDRRTRDRVARADRVTAAMPTVKRPGSHAKHHTHWVYPIYTDDPAELKTRLQTAGFDATQGASNMNAVDPPPDRPEHDPVNVRAAMDQILYLPVSKYLGPKDIEQLAKICSTPERK